MSVTLTRDSDRPHVAHLRIDENDLNLFSPGLATALHDTVTSVDDDVSVLTIAATQPDDGVRGLSAGLDIEWARDIGPHDAQDLLYAFYDAIQAIRDLEAVTVCGCGDYVLGVGLELAMACEFQVVTDDATLGLPEVNVGIPTVIHGGLLTRLVGVGLANELIYTGDPIDGIQAHDIGLVTDTASPDDYADAFTDRVATLAEKSPRVMQLQKRVMNRFRSNGLESGMYGSVADISRAFGHPDQRDAMTDFLD